MNKILIFTIIFLCLLSLISCGGSSSSSNGVVFQGSLTQGEDSNHKIFKHTANENIEGVIICALEECSTTDENGEWGFLVDPSFRGGKVTFKLDGHGINFSREIMIPEVNDNIYIHFQNQNQEVIVHHILVDGQAPLENHQDHEHSEHEEEHQH